MHFVCVEIAKPKAIGPVTPGLAPCKFFDLRHVAPGRVASGDGLGRFPHEKYDAAKHEGIEDPLGGGVCTQADGSTNYGGSP